MISVGGQWIYGYLFLAWLAAIAYNWFLIETAIRGVNAPSAYVERIGLGFPYVRTRHPSCPKELKHIYRSCMRWIYGPTLLLVALAMIID
ncbi:hypothetical protein [Neorhizobium alkalisoli]|jgi:hypothetical protein|uniref:Uncharacterized protein n=1 Tax=Neorhizobium alkalisoli TaxID=528178 RepID=A0A561QHQ0_9HYPH|nr:hypothetical protein [Neorhizobium alkalisoli]TWF49877.1 hypothetical protein FHW37_107244 [Neorhizobium alkalisoli]